MSAAPRHRIEIVGLTKAGGPLTKAISLGVDGRLVSDGSACVMSRGGAKRLRFERLDAFGALIASLDPNQAIALGALRADLPDIVAVTTQDRLAKLNGSAQPGLIARTGAYILYAPARPALALIDIDTKGMTNEVKARIKAAGGFWCALVSILPSLAATAHVVRRSTSTGITRTDTGEALPGSNGLHVYVLVQDGADVERFLRTLHERCWLAGFGWHLVGAGGQLLDRSLVDRTVYAPERLVFEAPPILIGPLVQDQSSRLPEVHDGDPLDTRAACPAFRISETTALKSMKAVSAYRFAPERAKEREKFINQHAERLAKRVGIHVPAARRIIERQLEGILLPDVVLPWDSEELTGCTVADVLADPARFVGATLADPLEGPDYGRSKAMVMRRADGSPWIHSFAHGRTVYHLRYDARAAAATVEAAPIDQAAGVFVRVVINSDLDADELETIRNRVSALASIGKRALDAKLKAAKKERDNRAKQEDRDRRAADRQDPRPQIPAPRPDAPWLPQMEVLNDVLGGSDLPVPPARDIDGYCVQVRIRRVPNMHLLTSENTNDGEAEEKRKPGPAQPLLMRLDETQLAEMIEHHIDYVDEATSSVHLAQPFVKHFHQRVDDALPLVAAIATLPLVLPNRKLLSRPGLDRQRGIVFQVEPDILARVPDPKECTDSAVTEAMRFLMDEWLVDVSASYVAKCILIAAVLTIIERSLLAERPSFFVTAGKRGTGKTTILIMLLVAATGVRPSAAAWSQNEEERRKSILAYLMEGLPAIVWDNIPRGTQIACPHIEKSCTTAFYSDRRLGVSENISVSAATIHMFTGNNIGPRGDLASRSLQARLEVDRPDPENRTFQHPDPIGWTEANRSKILRALYTVMIGNPVLRPNSNAVPQTRFKMWWRLVASAVEHAAELHVADIAKRAALTVADPPTCPPVAINFRDLFLAQEEDDEESASLADALRALAGKWPKAETFQASDVARLLNDRSGYQIDVDKERASTLRDFFFQKIPPNQDVSPKSVGRMLKNRVGEPVQDGERTLTLKVGQDAHSKTLNFHVHAK